MTTNRKRTVLSLLLTMACLVLFVALWVGAQQRQDARNRALIAAVKKNDTPAVVSWLTAGADPNAKDLPWDTRRMWRRIWDRVRGKPLPIDHTPTALLTAVEMRRSEDDWPPLFPPENLPLIQALVDAGADVNVANEDGTTPLMWATMATKREIVRLLLDRGARVNARDHVTLPPYLVGYC